MNYDEFIGQVQSRARLATQSEAIKATRATLETLGERLFGNEAEHLASQLPTEIKTYLTQATNKESFDLNEFFQRVLKKEGGSVELPDAVHHARAVIAVLCDAVSAGEINDALAQLPAEYDDLFEAGSEGTMQRRRAK
ncbi:MAG: DUF2267 domain-containing protein [wastewater metagenome]|nr:DUF2267 domain-containing protein [Candidatus Loosdrechtia aerotolerans]